MRVARHGRQALRHLLLDHQRHRRDRVQVIEEFFDHRHRHGIREVADDPERRRDGPPFFQGEKKIDRIQPPAGLESDPPQRGGIREAELPVQFDARLLIARYDRDDERISRPPRPLNQLGEKPPADESSTVHHDNIADTCGTCHRGIAQTFAGSVHVPTEPDTDESPAVYVRH